MLPDTLAIIDVETTGTSAKHGNIIELAIIRIEQGAIVDEYQTLINPNVPIPEEITLLTGITTAHIETAPVFSEVKQQVLDMLDGAVFCAHHAGFDYSFIKEEFRRLEIPYRAKLLDTVRLFRMLYPDSPRHNLDSLIALLGVTVEKRHRAYDDALVLWQFIKHMQNVFSESAQTKALAVAMRKPNLPPYLSEEMLDRLPEAPGVYLMYGDEEVPLYIGKSVNIHDRVLSHFAESGSVSKEFHIAQQVKRIEYIETAGELPALLLESSLIKKHLPIYNRHLRKQQKLTILSTPQISLGTYATIEKQQVSAIQNTMLDTLIGVFKSDKQAKNFLEEIGKEHQLCAKLLGLEKTRGACFWHQLSWCKGACIGKELPAAYNMRFTQATAKHKLKRWPFPGPVAISCQAGDKEETIIVDNWCIVPDEDKPTEYMFERDTYKILVKYLLTKHTDIHIAPITDRYITKY